MISYIQRDLFRTDTEVLLIKIEEIKESHDKVRRRLSAKVSTLDQEMLNLKERLEIIERNICNG